MSLNFILKFLRPAINNRKPALLPFFMLLLCSSSSLFSGQIVVVGGATVYNGQALEKGYAQHPAKMAPVTMYIGKGTVVTNVENIKSGNAELRLIHEKPALAKSAKKEIKKIAKTLKQEIARKKEDTRQNVTKTSHEITSRESSESLALLYFQTNEQCASINFYSKIKVAAVYEKWHPATFDTDHKPMEGTTSRPKHDFLYLLFDFTRPPPSFS